MATGPIWVGFTGCAPGIFCGCKKNWLAVKEDGLHNSLIAANGDFWGKLLDFANERQIRYERAGRGFGVHEPGFFEMVSFRQRSKKLRAKVIFCLFP